MSASSVGDQLLATLLDTEGLGDGADLRRRALERRFPLDHRHGDVEGAQLVERLGRAGEVGRQDERRLEGGDRLGRQRPLVPDCGRASASGG